MTDSSTVRTLLVAVTSAMLCSPSLAQDDLAKQSQNPLASLISMPFEFNGYTGIGPSDADAAVMIWKPVYPVNLGDWNMINRFLVPGVWTEGQDLPDGAVSALETGEAGRIEIAAGSASGVGDITYQPFFSPVETVNGWTWGVAPVVVFPTATEDRFASDKWQAGAGVVALTMPGNWVLGVLLQNVWSVAGDSDAADVNAFLFQYFINYNLSNGWYLSTTPVNTANWEADSENRWTVPLGGGVGKMVRIGKLPVDLKLAAYGYAENPEFGADWNAQFTIKFLFPK